MTTDAKHLILVDESVSGWEYGMLRCFENAIVSQTGAQRLLIEQSKFSRWLNRRFGHGTRYNRLRRLFPRRAIDLPKNAEVLWHVLMGVENYRLDRFQGWQDCAKRRVVYHFDTLPAQLPLLRRLFSSGAWSDCVTSFNDAVSMLEHETRRSWLHADQAVSSAFFQTIPIEQRLIHFSAYGRRHPKVHEAVIAFCAANNLYYDFTTHGCSHPTAEPLQLFRQFSWHMSHSLFTFCWPVEVTTPQRAGPLSPITCRWFEGAAAGAIVLGQAPRNPHFRELFGDDFVIPLEVNGSVERIVNQLEGIWAKRIELFHRAQQIRQRMGKSLDWSARVANILSHLAACRT